MPKIALICPAVRPTVSQLAEAGPLVTTPILGECLVNHWIEALATKGTREIIIYAADRPDEVRRVAGDGRRWGVTVEVRDSKIETTVDEVRAADPSIEGVAVMSHLPGTPDLPLFDSYASWYAAVAAWIPLALTPTRVRLSEVRPGIWMSRRAHVSPGAQLIAPCWIGDQVMVKSGAIVGPGAILEDRAVVETGARVVESVVGPDTYVGRMSSVVHSLAHGATLINWQSDSWLRVPDPFLLCSLAGPLKATRWPRRSPARGTKAGGPFSVLTAFFSRFTTRPEPTVPAVPVADRHTTP